jgi:hypothetical protein
MKTVESVKPDKPREIRSCSFMIRILSNRHETWQGTITLLGRKATRATRLPGIGTPGSAPETLTGEAETISFRSLLELIHLIDSALGEKE